MLYKIKSCQSVNCIEHIISQFRIKIKLRTIRTIPRIKNSRTFLYGRSFPII